MRSTSKVLPKRADAAEKGCRLCGQLLTEMNLRQKLSGGAVILLGLLQAYLYVKGQPPPPALDQAFIAALGALVAPKQVARAKHAA